ncbi:hypothetical protein [Hymenobacter cellulosivorans]|uniref:Uncharacterized protein n=1 Tax=Hymenobacter cellulosivorans TaxID=2932249 RepID=A0ABY4F2W3_9BACT|nr:hypothetical protein [Hymenobacter cellulosivorans]UOQ51007.1 hypothetical protein MUN80_14700 [Hymenobacter cellulosivorans]
MLKVNIISHQMLYPRFFACFGVAALLAGCTIPDSKVAEKKVQVAYTIKEGEKTLDFKGSKAWQPAWSDSLIARLERGSIPAYDTDNKPLAATALPRGRQVHGLVLEQTKDGELRDDGVMLLPPRNVIGVLGNDATSGITLYFYDQSVSMEHFYARVRQADLEKLIGAPLEFVAAQQP